MRVELKRSDQQAVSGNVALLRVFYPAPESQVDQYPFLTLQTVPIMRQSCNS